MERIYLNENSKINALNKRIETINSIKEQRKKGDECRKLFYDVLKEGSLFIVASAKTTKQEWDEGIIKPFIGAGPSSFGEFYYLRLFTEEELAKKFARREEALSDAGVELTVKLSLEQFILLVKDNFIMGVDGVLLNDGADWITLNCDAILNLAYVDILNMPDAFNLEFVNTVNAIYDIAKGRVRIVAPVKHFEGIKKEDIINKKAELYTFGSDLLMLEYYDKYKVEKLFTQKVYWLDMDINIFHFVVSEAINNGVSSIKIVYKNKQSSGSPKEILGLLEGVGFKGMGK